MLCKPFSELNIFEKRDLILKLNHLIQTYEGAFSTAKQMVDKAEKEGLFDGIVFQPENIINNEYTEGDSNIA